MFIIVYLFWYTNTVKIRVQCGKTCMHINTQTYYTNDVVNPMPFQPSPRSACLWVFHGIPTIPKLVMADIGIGFPTLYCSACGKEPRIRGLSLKCISSNLLTNTWRQQKLLLSRSQKIGCRKQKRNSLDNVNLMNLNLHWLVVQCAHLEKLWSSSMGRMTSHIWNGT